MNLLTSLTVHFYESINLSHLQTTLTNTELPWASINKTFAKYLSCK